MAKRVVESGIGVLREIGLRAFAAGVDSVLSDVDGASKEVRRRVKRAKKKLRDMGVVREVAPRDEDE